MATKDLRIWLTDDERETLKAVLEFTVGMVSSRLNRTSYDLTDTFALQLSRLKVVHLHRKFGFQPEIKK